MRTRQLLGLLTFFSKPHNSKSATSVSKVADVKLKLRFITKTFWGKDFLYYTINRQIMIFAKER